MIDGSGEYFPLPDEDECPPQTRPPVQARLDSLLPVDPGGAGAVCHDAMRTYLGAVIDLMARHAQPLTLLAIAPDPNETIRLLGATGARLITAAVARALRQETRVHDVVGLADACGPDGSPTFLVVLPLMTESLATPFAERLRVALTSAAVGDGHPWLTLSVGVAALSLDTCSPESLTLRAQEALASARRAGGGRVWGHSDTVRRIIDGSQPDP